MIRKTVQHIILLYLFIALSGNSVWAQDSISYTEYRHKVLAYSQVLKQAKESVVASIARKEIARTGYLPKLDFSAQGAIDLRKLSSWSVPAGEPRNYTYVGDLVLSQNIYSGGAVRGQYQASKMELDISELSQQLTFDNIFYQADVVYWNASALREIYAASIRYYEIVKSLHDIILIRFNDGMIGKTDLLMITTRLKEAELQQSISEKNYLLAHQQLNILMGIEPSQSSGAIDPIEQYIPTPERLTLTQVLTRRPDYRTVEKQIGLQEEYRKIAVSKYNPQMGVAFDGGWGSSLPTGDPEFSGLASLSLKIPIFYWGERKQTNRANRAAINIKKLELMRVTDQISSELSAAWTSIEQSDKQKVIAEENLTLAQENLDLITFSYNEGKNPILDVLSAQLSWIQAYTNFVSSLLNHKIALAEYQKAIGGIE